MNYTEKSRELPIRGDYDVIVAGSGPSGMGAALSAARAGASVLLLEYFGTVGGMSTTGMMSHWTGRVQSKLYTELLTRSSQRYFADRPESERGIVNTIDPEKLKKLYLDMLNEAGVKLLLYTFAADTIVENDTVKGVITENKSGRAVYTARVVVDATGDGDVAAKSGAEYYIGRESDSLMQPATLMFKVGGVDYSRAVFPPSFETLVPTDKGELQQLASEILPHPAGHVLLYRSTLPGIVTCNMTNVTGIDGSSAESLTEGEIVCREQMEHIVKFLREYVPGYEHCYIVSSGSMLGIRETRHFKGVKTINEEDILEARQFDDWAVRGAHFNFDVHNITGAGLDRTGVQHRFPQLNGYTIPYGCLVPEKVDGLLLSGRCISGTHMAHSNFRVMPICLGIGEAAGYAAALSVKYGISPRDVNISELQSLLAR